jgi:hypothetical protein
VSTWRTRTYAHTHAHTQADCDTTCIIACIPYERATWPGSFPCLSSPLLSSLGSGPRATVGGRATSAHLAPFRRNASVPERSMARRRNSRFSSTHARLDGATQSGLWRGQSAFWHAFEQYFMARHREHTWNGPSPLSHSPQQAESIAAFGSRARAADGLLGTSSAVFASACAGEAERPSSSSTPLAVPRAHSRVPRVPVLALALRRAVLRLTAPAARLQLHLRTQPGEA